MVKVPLDPITASSIDIRLYRNVQNVPELRAKVMSGSLDCCFVNPKLILDQFQLIISANKALIAENRTTKSIFTEILFNLSISKNISKSLQQFGINNNDRDFLVVTVIRDGNDTSAVYNQIKGEEVDLDQLKEISDLDAIRKAYKIRESEEKCSTVLDSIISRIATKDFVSH